MIPGLGGVPLTLIASGVIIIGLATSTWYYKGKYEDTYKDLIIQTQNTQILSSSLDKQNDEIEKMKIDTEKFKADYQEVIKNRSEKAIQPLILREVKTCNDMLEIIDQLE